MQSDNSNTNPAFMSTGAFIIEKLKHRRVRMGNADAPFVALLHYALRPFIAASSLLLLLQVLGHPLSYASVALAVMVFITSGQLLTKPPHRGQTSLSQWFAQVLPRLLLEWSCVVAVMLFIGFAMRIPELASRPLILAWSLTTPTIMVLMELCRTRITRLLVAGNTVADRYVVIGANELALELTRRTANTGHSTFVGFFDDRSADRLPRATRHQLLGRFEDVVGFVQQNGIGTVYISLPVTGNERIRNLITQLRDTTASVYVLPDVLSFDIIQARVAEIDGLPVVSLYDTPFDGRRALFKRGMDLMLASLALLFIWPVMLLIAIGVKLSSAGPVLFKQQRYGMNGEKIAVYKFRSMTVCENGAQVTQATRNDARITPFGRFLRQSSLDELPQIINVLEGKMSLVGPRPHAVTHNEQYRKLIEGYMFRHKVRPGITGWAQVNGLRGETETVDKMRKRIEYDLDYLRHWSLWMDLKIVFKTIRLVFNDSKAY
ncbi:MAG: undecaprenyl-phosphate glucose phosphotransferase [Steroidobacteraceae bacterium]